MHTTGKYRSKKNEKTSALDIIKINNFLDIDDYFWSN